MEKMSLEEAIASVNFPVYGHTCEVLGLRYEYCSFSTPIPMLSISYHDNRYEQKLTKKFRRPAFSVGSSQGSRNEDLVCPSPGITYRPFNSGGSIDLVKPIRYEKEEFILDGTHFIASIQYYPDPLFRSISSLWSIQTQLFVNSLGPSLEELYELIKALHVLNPGLSV
jgi:hypothetical protein